MKENYEILNTNLYSKIFNIPEKLMHIPLSNEIKYDDMVEKFGEPGNEGFWLILYNIQNIRVPIIINKNLLISYEKYQNWARSFITEVLFNKSDESSENEIKNEIIINPSFSDL